LPLTSLGAVGKKTEKRVKFNFKKKKKYAALGKAWAIALVSQRRGKKRKWDFRKRRSAGRGGTENSTSFARKAFEVRPCGKRDCACYAEKSEGNPPRGK